MSPRTGRPPSDNPKRHETRIRMTDGDVEMLDYCCKFYGLSKAEVIRRGIKELYQKAQEK